jgi:homocitrate synthase NifV
MILIDATLAVMGSQGQDISDSQAQKWVKSLAALGITRVKRPYDPVVTMDALYGLDGALWGDYSELFKGLRKLGPMEVVFGDSYGCATALAVSWFDEGGLGVVASLAGIGGLPALEILRLALHLSGRMILSKDKMVFANVARLFEDMTGRSIDLFAPVLGRGLFVAESGVHVNGWLKDPSLYEPFPPETTNAKRALAIGRHSGRGALRLKCWQLGLNCPSEELPGLLTQVRERAEELERSLTDMEFAELAKARVGVKLEAVH